jgi:formylglycine-generating enzyme required for sulfatase activity
MFAGRRAFSATETSQIMFSHLNEIPEPPSKHAPNLPPQISKAIFKALEKDPEDRFPDFKAFKQAIQVEQAESDDATSMVDLEAVMADATIDVGPAEMPTPKAAQAPAAEKKKKPTAMLAAIIAFVLIAGGVGGYFLLKKGSSETEQRTAETPTTPAPAKKPAAATAAGPGQKNSKGYNEVKNQKDGSIMVSIPAGEFTMGSDKYSAERPVQKISLDSYYIDKYLVTNEKFAKFVEESKYKTDAEKEGAGNVRIGRRWKKTEGASWKKPDGLTAIDGKENHPVSQVSYNDASAYCTWAQKNLPTEAQWEKAARGPDGNEYPWGNSEPNDTSANFDSNVGTTTPVTEYEKGQSFYGVQDMAGNVYQWCKDWYGTGDRDAQNPAGPKEGKERVIKGGSFIEGMESLRSANRDRYEPNYSSFLFGFRCAGTNPKIAK